MIQKILDFASKPQVQQLLAFILQKVFLLIQIHYFLAFPYGCKVIQKIIQNKLLPMNAALTAPILQNAVTLSECQFGNYIIQSLLKRSDFPEKSLLIDRLLNAVIHLSKNKFASNVIEKCLSLLTGA